FVRDALLKLSGRDPVPALPAFQVPCTSSLKKAPGRTEFQRGILSQDAAGNWSVRVTGEQGSGILRSMSEANCFIILAEAQGNVAPGAMVEVQVLEGVIYHAPRRPGLERHSDRSGYDAARHRARMHARRTPAFFRYLLLAGQRNIAAGAGAERQRQDEPPADSLRTAAAGRRGDLLARPAHTRAR